MDVYVFHAALWCADCARNEQSLLRSDLKSDTGDSDDFPQGPYPGGGGEADSPQHCDHCGVFLRNPLTPEGRSYVRGALIDGGDSAVLEMWRDFYGIDDTDFGS